MYGLYHVSKLRRCIMENAEYCVGERGRSAMGDDKTCFSAFINLHEDMQLELYYVHI